MGWLVGVVCVVVILGLAYCCYWVAFYNPESRHKEAVITKLGKERPQLDALYKEMEGLPCEQVTISSDDGLTLGARYYHVRDDAPLHIQFHGYRGNGLRDFCAVHRIVREAGINTLVVDQRAHGMSGGNTLTFGILERYDCLRWAQYAAQRFGTAQPIFLSGVSMGAATVLMASELPLPENVAGIVADCPYSSPGAIIRKVCRDMKVPGWLIYPFVVLGALAFGRFRLWDGSPVRAVGKTHIPILLIHGSEDRYVPSSMSGEIFDACGGEKYLEVFPGAAHGGSCVTDSARYEKIIRSFMALCVEKRGGA